MRTLASLIHRSHKRQAQMEGLHQYTQHALDKALIGSFASPHKRFKAAVAEGVSEGMIKAALFSALREHLPRGWFVQVDAAYPVSRAQHSDEADVLAWSPLDVPVAFEVQGHNDYEAIRADLDTIEHHARMRSSALVMGYVVFPVFDQRHLNFWRDMRNEWRPAFPVPVAMF